MLLVGGKKRSADGMLGRRNIKGMGDSPFLNPETMKMPEGGETGVRMKAKGRGLQGCRMLGYNKHAGGGEVLVINMQTSMAF
jgi:hypothetical protein